MSRIVVLRTGFRVALALTLLGVTLTLDACRAGGGSPYASQSEATRNPLEAQRLTLRAAQILEKSPTKTEQVESLLREALTADLYHGPAHNDLGVAYLKRGQLYEAAAEFEWARKLLPGHPDPRLNLALTLERAGRIDDASRTYASALEVYPGHMPTLQALTRLQLRHKRTDEHTHERLEQVALGGTTTNWRTWARGQLSRGNGP